MSGSRYQPRSQLVGKTGHFLKWSWISPYLGTVPEDSLNVSENDDQQLLICLAMNTMNEWILKSFDPDKDTVTNEMKFLVVDGEPQWKNMNPAAMILPDGAIYGEFAGKYGKMFVGRHSSIGLFGMVVTTNMRDWSFYTHDKQGDLKNYGIHVLCMD